MAAILCTVDVTLNKVEEDGPFPVDSVRAAFIAITMNGTYDQAARPKICHDSAGGLLSVLGMKRLVAIEFLAPAVSAVAGNNTDTGHYVADYDFNKQEIIVYRCGCNAAGPVDQAEIGTGAAINGGNALLFPALVYGV